MIAQRPGTLWLCASLFWGGVVFGAGEGGDVPDAQTQYRIARRLAAEGSKEAASALRRVVELEPNGPLADDALLDEARLENLPLWPEELGRLLSAARERALVPLDRLVSTCPEGDRMAEARVLRGLLFLEPLPGRNEGRARQDLVFAATASRAPWSSMARYALARLDEWNGNGDRASAAYHRLLVDHAEEEAAARAGVGIARTLLLRGEAPGRAAAWLEEALDRGVDAALGAEDLRETAVRSLLRQGGSGAVWSPAGGHTVASGIEGASALARGRGGDLVIGIRKERSVARFDASGRVVARWQVEDVHAICVDPFGRIFVAAGPAILRLDPGGDPLRVAEAGDLAPVGSLALDPAGRILVLNRKGDRMGVFHPGEPRPRVVREGKGFSIASLAWDGRRVIALEPRTGNLVQCDPDASTRALATEVVQGPVLLAATAGGAIAILDRSGDVVLLDGAGRPTDRLPARTGGIEKVSAIALGWDGSLDLLDEAKRRVLRIP